MNVTVQITDPETGQQRLVEILIVHTILRNENKLKRILRCGSDMQQNISQGRIKSMHGMYKA
jgi:hypothetical protein